MDDADGKKILELMDKGFKEVNDKLEAIQFERQFEKGQEINKKTEKNSADIELIKEWKITTNTTLVNSRRMIWILVGAVVSLIVSAGASLIVYTLGH